MKRFWSAFLSLTLLAFLVGCSQEQFVGQQANEQNGYTPPKTLTDSSCGESFTLIKPKVDILYVVDNSYSNYYIANDIKTSITNTVNSISQDFDYRIVGIPLISSSNDTQTYQVYSNSTDLAGLPTAPRKISNINDFNFFAQQDGGTEKGLSRIHDFMNAHANGLFRKGAYHLVILVSNGQDQEVELSVGEYQPQIYCVGNPPTLNTSCPAGQSVYEQRLQSFTTLKGPSKLDSQQFRIFSVTAPNACQSGWKPSEYSYRKMSRALYSTSGASDSSSQDTFNLCNGSVSTIFASVYAAIQKIKIPHKYKYWPITFANNNKPMLQIVGSYSDIEVYKFENSTSTTGTLLTNWQYFENTNYPATINTTVAELPTGVEEATPVSARHFIQFNSLNEVVHPNCLLVRAKEKTEYFEWIVVQQKPDTTKTITVRINGVDVPQSSTNGWSYNPSGQPMSKNTKADYPNAGDNQPPVMGSGFMFKLNGTNNYYKSGDQVNVHFTPAPI